MDFKEEIKKFLEKELGILVNLEIPPNAELGDYAFPCFALAKVMKKSPVEIAKELEAKVIIQGVQAKAAGPYLNFFVSKQDLSKNVLKEIFADKNYGGSGKTGKKMVIEYPGPNTNKPLHLGHVRNICLGYSLCRINGAAGNTVISVNVNNDRGVHICKSMLAYQKWGKRDSPSKSKMKSDFFVGKYYVMFCQKAKENPALEEEALEMLRKWEAGDKKVVALWKKMNKWAFDGFKKTYKTFDVRFKKEYFESKTYKKGKEMVLEGLKNNAFKKNDEGAVVVGLSQGEKVLLRADGTSVYITQDLYMAKLRYDDFKFDKMVYVVATEQNYHFQILFELFKLLNLPFADKCHHFAYGMVNLTTGKMKSREGTVVDADTLVDEMKELALNETLSRHKKIAKKEAEKRAFKIAMSAIRFYILKNDPIKDMLFDPKQSISFEGDTGPYVQYAYARCSSILRKHRKKVSGSVNFSLLTHESETAVIKTLEDFPKTVASACSEYKPSLIANYLLKLSQEFSNFYSKCPVISDDKELTNARVLLVYCARKVIGKGLFLLGIDTLEEM